MSLGCLVRYTSLYCVDWGATRLQTNIRIHSSFTSLQSINRGYYCQYTILLWLGSWWRCSFAGQRNQLCVWYQWKGFADKRGFRLKLTLAALHGFKLRFCNAVATSFSKEQNESYPPGNWYGSSWSFREGKCGLLTRLTRPELNPCQATFRHPSMYICREGANIPRPDSYTIPRTAEILFEKDNGHGLGPHSSEPSTTSFGSNYTPRYVRNSGRGQDLGYVQDYGDEISFSPDSDYETTNFVMA